MQLHRLSLQAIGPFAGAVEIDFAELSASGLFLLEGPTGAGKSTLIDAIVFALYGTPASEGSSADRLRSGHVGADVESYVDLSFETSHGVFRVRRTPRHERLKSRGSGTTTQQASVTLWDGSGGVRSTRLDEAGAELQRIVGLDRQQFVQTVVLPQGEFSRFLRARPEDRRAVLQRIFGTQAYERLQVRLAELRREADRGLQAARTEVDAARDTFVGACDLAEGHPLRTGDLPAPQGPAAAGGPGAGAGGAADAGRADAVGDVAWARAVGALAAEVAGGFDADAEAAEAALREAHGTLVHARAEVEARREAREAHRRSEELLGRLDRVDGEAAAQTDRVSELGAAERAAVVRPLLRGRDRAASAVVDSGEALASVAAADDGRADVDPAALRHDDAGRLDAALAALRERLAELGRETALLDGAAQVEQGLPARRRALEALREEQRTAAAELRAREETLEARPALRAGLLESLAAARERAATQSALQGAAARAERSLQAARTAADLGERLGTARRSLEEAAEEARRHVDAVAELRRGRIAGIAAELAVVLRAGDPCPVCGAVEHPAPAAPGAGHVHEEDVALAEADHERAQSRLQEAAEAVTALGERRAAAQGEAEGRTVDDWAAALERAQTDLLRARAAAEEVTRIEQAVAEHERETTGLREGLGALVSDQAVRAQRLDVERNELDRAVADVEAARDGLASVAARRTRLLELGTRTERLHDALDRHRLARRELASREAELEAVLREQGFGDPAQAQSAVRDTDAIDALRAAVHAHRDEIARLRAALLGSAGPDAPEDPDDVGAAARAAARRLRAGLGAAAGDAGALDAAVLAAERALAEADGRAVAATERVTLARRRAEAAGRALTRLRDAVAALAGVAEAAAPVRSMANLATASGRDNARQVPLATFVLMRRFEEVLAAANERLRTLSDGRFELVRSDERETGGGLRTGLALKVVDHRIEAERDVRSLSGGETFYASLSLALGMADVVTAEAGGVDLGTLFVDEGFGTLDAEALDGVLAVLGSLRAGGRTVGVVSHVETLRQSIAEQIQVRRLPGGDSAVIVRAG